MKFTHVVFLVTFFGLFTLPVTILAEECYESQIVSPSPFMGNNGEIFKLSDGSVWEVKHEYEYLYEYSPSVMVCPDRGKLFLDEKTLNVALLSSTAPKTGASGGSWELYEETNLQGSISGMIEQGHIFKTTSGNIYEVVGLTLQLVLALQPDVMVFRSGSTYKLVVEDFDEPLICSKLN